MAPQRRTLSFLATSAALTLLGVTFGHGATALPSAAAPVASVHQVGTPTLTVTSPATSGATSSATTAAKAPASSPAKPATTTAAAAKPATPTASPAAVATTAPATPAVTGQRQAAADAAAALATSKGWSTGIAIVDLQTGQTTTAGAANGLFPTESTVKVLLAANLLATGQMSGAVAATAHEMVVASDDDSADALYYATDGDNVTQWAATRYGINHLGTPPVNGSGEWGSTQVSPLGMATFLADAAKDPAVGPWLTATMTAMQPTAADGTNQLFGIKVAAPTAAVKQGWGGDTVGLNSETTPSIGIVDGRYAVAIYTLHATYVPESTAMALVTQQAQTLLPGGHVPAL